MENTLGFNSTTGAVKHLIMTFMGTEEKEVERRVLVKHIKENLKDNPSLTDGVIAGAIKILVNSGELVVVHRGCYKKGIVKASLSPLEQICQVCIRFKNSLEKACTVNAMELSAALTLKFISLSPKGQRFYFLCSFHLFSEN